MTIESVTYISDLNATYPAASDPKSEGDDHIRNLKTGIKATFPNITGAVTPTHTELNYVDGVTSAIQGQIDLKAPLASPTFTGTVVLPTDTSIGNVSSTEIGYLDGVTSALQTQLAAKAPLASPTFTGTVTVPTPSAATDASTKAYVDGVAFATVLPSQTGNSGKYVTTDGSTASWGTINIPTVDSARTWTTQQVFKELKDTVYTITDGANFEIDPVNGSVQTITLGASRTAAATNFEAGQTVILGVDDGTAYALTWPTMTWVKSGGTAAAPTLATTGYTWVLLWKVGSTLYGAIVGSP